VVIWRVIWRVQVDFMVIWIIEFYQDAGIISLRILPRYRDYLRQLIVPAHPCTLVEFRER
jgi:hypothetical protein